MTRRRNTRDRQLRRWASRVVALDRRNGVYFNGYDPRHVGQLLPWCVEAYLARSPIAPRMSTQNYRRLEWRLAQPRHRNTH
ncbi:hypothetical protein JOF29_005224 [Kribbella aluminosa]|uniref:Uncharacterized protein n=1 Tax=Kribbella aluminosa TaxID=416017 RepID=A0ABS4URB2_9ACTN|nr:hypothetical protein [Kribbella aluminosa]